MAELRAVLELIVPLTGLMILDIWVFRFKRAELEPEMLVPFKLSPAAAAAYATADVVSSLTTTLLGRVSPERPTMLTRLMLVLAEPVDDVCPPLATT